MLLSAVDRKGGIAASGLMTRVQDAKLDFNDAVCIFQVLHALRKSPKIRLLYSPHPCPAHSLELGAPTI